MFFSEFIKNNQLCNNLVYNELINDYYLLNNELFIIKYSHQIKNSLGQRPHAICSFVLDYNMDKLDNYDNWFNEINKHPDKDMIELHKLMKNLMFNRYYKIFYKSKMIM